MVERVGQAMSISTQPISHFTDALLSLICSYICAEVDTLVHCCLCLLRFADDSNYFIHLSVLDFCKRFCSHQLLAVLPRHPPIVRSTCSPMHATRLAS